MEIKVKAVEGNTQKSKAEIEEQLLQKHEAQQVEAEVQVKPEKVIGKRRQQQFCNIITQKVDAVGA